MANSPTDGSAQASNAESAILIQGINVGQIGILLIQGFAIFAAFSTLLGRIYFRTYANALEIPESEFRLNAISYSVISPDVAIAGVGVALFSIAIVISFRLRINPNYRTFIFCAGLVLLVSSSISVIKDFFNQDIPESGIGVLGIWWLLITTGWTLGTALILSTLGSWLTSTPSGNKRPRRARRSDKRNQSTLFNHSMLQYGLRMVGLSALVSVGVVAAALLLVMPFLQATIVGRMDASLQLRDAPLVVVEVTSSSLFDDLNGDEDKSDEDRSIRRFRLIHTSENFVFVRPPGLSCICPTMADLSPGEPYQYALPVSEIRSIAQILEPD